MSRHFNAANKQQLMVPHAPLEKCTIETKQTAAEYEKGNQFIHTKPWHYSLHYWKQVVFW